MAAAVLAVLAVGGGRWWAAARGPSAATGRLASMQTTATSEQPKHQNRAYRSDTPILPAEIRMDFPGEKIAEDLEAEFEASYHPPAYCDNWQSREQMVACGNDRIRAWKEYRAKHWALRRLDTARAEIPPSN
ncbi:MAG: hypothetical protein P8Y25_09650 [Chromatiaceae bacterium]